MNQLRYLEKCDLLLATYEKQANGSFKIAYTSIGKYSVQVQKVTDSVSATIYGANLNRTYRFQSFKRDLEQYLSDKFNYSDDNVTSYIISFNDKKYKVVAINDNWVDAQLQ